MATKVLSLTSTKISVLELFNAVLVTEKAPVLGDDIIYLTDTLEYGFMLHPDAAQSLDAKLVIKYLIDNKLTGADLNKSFHKSWNKILTSTREELLIHQLVHYMTTYGFDALGIYNDNTVYFPDEALDVPEVKISELTLRVVNAITSKEVIEKCLGLFQSGIALEEETIDKILAILKDLNYKFTSEVVDTLKNKEAVVKIATTLGVYPTNPSEFVRFLVFMATGSTLVIKSREAISEIINSKINISVYAQQFGLARLSEVFLRYKPLFLAFRKANIQNRPIVNQLRRLAKYNHKPMKEDYLNIITSQTQLSKKKFVDALDRVNNFRKIRLLYALHTRMIGTDARVYKIRNGKTFITKGTSNANYQPAYDIVLEHLVKGLDLNNKVILYPELVDYALPSSEKMFIGNMPTGTSFNVGSDALFGIYWRNDWGARDLDLSAQSLNVKVGWNAAYKVEGGGLMYSGDITNAHNGATEFLYAAKGLSQPYIVNNNIYSGEIGCKMKLIFAKAPISDNRAVRDYIIDPNDVIAELDTTMDSRQQVLGMFIPTENGVRMVLCNFQVQGGMVARSSELTNLSREFLMNQYANPLYLSDILSMAGANLIHKMPAPPSKPLFIEDAEVIEEIETPKVDIDLSVENLQKDTIIKLLS